MAADENRLLRQQKKIFSQAVLSALQKYFVYFKKKKGQDGEKDFLLTSKIFSEVA